MSQEVLEGNRLIAEFMGFTQGKSELGNTYTHPDKMGVYGGVGMKFQYHTSWEWLWPVAQKIGELTGAITLEAIFRNLTDHYGKLICNRRDLWEACVKFINHYNQTQKR